MDSTVDPTYEVSLFALVMGCIFTCVGVIGNLLTIIALLRDLLRIWVHETIQTTTLAQPPPSLGSTDPFDTIAQYLITVSYKITILCYHYYNYLLP